MKPIRLEDQQLEVTVQRRKTIYSGAIWDIQQETFTMFDDEEPMTREFIQHPGAVAVVAIDEFQRVAMIRQYRHPLGENCWEIPAGLMDNPHDSRLETAKNELAEEAGLTAEEWSTLIDHAPSSGSSTERIRIYLARQLSTLSEDMQHTRSHEEAHILLRWVPIKEALDAVMNGKVRNVNAVAGIMATHIYMQKNQ